MRFVPAASVNDAGSGVFNELSINTSSVVTGTPSELQFARLLKEVPVPLLPPSHVLLAASTTNTTTVNNVMKMSAIMKVASGRRAEGRRRRSARAFDAPMLLARNPERLERGIMGAELLRDCKQ